MITLADLKKINTAEALDNFLERQFESDPERFIVEVNRSLNHLLQSDLKQAQQLTDMLADIFRYLPKRYSSRLKAMTARVDHWSGNSKQALTLYKQAIKQMISGHEYETAARTRMGLMDVLMYLGYNQEALQQGRKALKYFRRKNMDSMAGRVMTNMGNIYHRLDNNRMALRYYDNAREIFKANDGIPLAIVDYNRANIFTNMGHLKQAEKLYRATSKIYTDNDMHIAACKADYSLAYLYFLSDKFSRALKIFEGTYERFRKLGDNKSAAVVRLDLAEINLFLNQPGLAVMQAEELKSTFKKFKLNYELGKAGYFSAEGLYHLGDNQNSAGHLNQALKIFEKEDNKLWQAMANLLQGRLALEQGNYQKAAELTGNSGALFKKSGDHRRLIDASIVEIQVLLRAGDLKQASKSAANLLKKHPLRYQRYELYNILGQVEKQQGNYKKALGYFRKAAGTSEEMIKSLYPDEIRYFFALGKQEVYDSAVDCLLKLNQVKDSFLENSHALALINGRQSFEQKLSSTVPEKYIRQREGLRARLKELNLVSKGGQRSAHSPGLNELENKLWHTEQRIRAILYPGRSQTRIDQIDLPQIQSALKDRKKLVNFLTADNRVGAFIIDKDHIRYVDCDLELNELEQIIREMSFLMENSVYSSLSSGRSLTAINHYLRTLYQKLIAPLELEANIRELVILADGLFGQIPYNALLDNTIPLCDKCQIRHTVSPADLLATGSKFSTSLTSSIYASSASGLLMVDHEAELISQVFRNARQYIGAEASIENFKAGLESSQGFIHVATHASRSAENPLFSRILLNNGPFFPFDLFGARIKAKLITLSGCQTAAPGIYYGNSFSLAKAFYQSGAENILASLWPVSDKISMIFMVEFYRELADRKNIQASYHEALHKIRQKCDNPAFWSAFILLG